MFRLTLIVFTASLLTACSKDDSPIIVETNDITLKITAPYKDEKFERGLAVSVDGILQSEEYISGYEVLFIHQGTGDTLDYYYEEGNFNYYTVHHHWVNKLTAPTTVTVVVNAVDQGEILATASLPIFCKG